MECLVAQLDEGRNRVLIIGAGAIGGITGAMLHEANIDVCLIDKNKAHVQAIQEHGLQIENFPQPIHVPIKADLTKVQQQYPHVIIAVKSPFTEQVIQALEGHLTPNALIYSFQNGLGNTDIMANYYPRNQIVAGVIGWGASNLGPGKLRVTSSTGNFVIGFENKESLSDHRLHEMREMLQVWRPTIITEDIMGYRWAKLIINSVIATYGGLLGMTVGDMLGHPQISELMGDLGYEGIQVADALGIALQRVDGLNIRNFFYKPSKNDGVITKTAKTLITKIMKKIGARRHGKIRSSLLTDLERGIKTEVDFLNGYIVQKAKEVKLKVPINTFLVKAIHEIEDGKRTIGLDNLPELKEVAEKSREIVQEQMTKVNQ